MPGIETNLDEYICAAAGEPDVSKLVNTAHQVQRVPALTDSVLQRIEQTD